MKNKILYQNKCLLLILFTLLWANLTVLAQINTFSGKQIFGGKEGTATYDYLFTNGKSTIEGNFQFYAHDNSLIISGNYSNDKKEGIWHYKHIFTDTLQNTTLIDSITEIYNIENDKISVRKKTTLLDGTLQEELLCNYHFRTLNESYYYCNYITKTEIKGILENGQFSGIVNIDKNNEYQIQNGWITYQKVEGEWTPIIPSSLLPTLQQMFIKNRTQKQFTIGDTLIEITEIKHLPTYLSNFSGVPQNIMRIGAPAYFFITTIHKNDTTSSDSLHPQEDKLRRIASDWIEQDIQNSINQAREDAQRRERELAEMQRKKEEEARLAEETRIAKENTIQNLTHEIITYHTTIQEKCKTRDHKNLFKSYETVISHCDIIHTDTSSDYINSLHKYLEFQKIILQDFLINSKINLIQQNQKEIEQKATNSYKDIGKSYKKIFKKQNFIPIFNTLDEFEQYNKSLDTFEKLQEQYLATFSLRRNISEQAHEILSFNQKYCQKIVQLYKKANKSLQKTPSFTTEKDGNIFIDNLTQFSEAQKITLTILNNILYINQLHTTFEKELEKNKNIRKAYTTIYHYHITPPQTYQLTNIQTYNQQLEKLIKYQEKFLLISKAPTVKEINKELRNISDIRLITKIIGL